MWGLLLNRSRDIVRMCVSFFPEEDMQRKATFSRWMIALCQSLKCHLRPGYAEDLEDDLKGVLCQQEMTLLMTADHKVTIHLCVWCLSHEKNHMNTHEFLLCAHLPGCMRRRTTWRPPEEADNSTMHTVPVVDPCTMCS